LVSPVATGSIKQYNYVFLRQRLRLHSGSCANLIYLPFAVAKTLFAEFSRITSFWFGSNDTQSRISCWIYLLACQECPNIIGTVFCFLGPVSEGGSMKTINEVYFFSLQKNLFAQLLFPFFFLIFDHAERPITNVIAAIKAMNFFPGVFL
jgi:hypothetical protein